MHVGVRRGVGGVGGGGGGGGDHPCLPFSLVVPSSVFPQ